MTEQKNLNSFSYSGVIAKKPEQKPGLSMTMVETIVEQTSTYRDKVTVTSLQITAWHEQAKILLNLKVGDHVFIRGKIKTSPWTDKRSGEVKHFVNMIADIIFPTTTCSIAPQVSEPATTFDSDTIPF